MPPLYSDVFEINNDVVRKVEGRARQYLSFYTNYSDEVAFKNAVAIEFLGFLGNKSGGDIVAKFEY